MKRANADVLRVTAVTKRYARSGSRFHVSFDIAPDSITGIIGPNGAGKTTLVSMLAGHVPPTEGRIHLGDTAVHKTAAHQVGSRGPGARPFKTFACSRG